MTLFDIEWSLIGGLIGASLVLLCLGIEWLVRSGALARLVKQPGRTPPPGDTPRPSSVGSVERMPRPVAVVASPRPDPPPADSRVTHCYACKTGLDSRQHTNCASCGWIICPACGACGCGYVG
jgi:hypothetical protein